MAQVVTMFGVDVSNWNGKVDWDAVAAAGVEFAFAKATEGVHFKDRTWPRNRAGMLALGERFVPGAYCYLRGDADITRQVELFLETVGDVSPLMIALDVERRDGVSRQATAEDARKWVTEFKNHTGGHPVLGYFPRWYWRETGEGDLSFFDTLWESHYVSGEGAPGTLYDRVPAAWWRGYGDESVSILQFSDCGKLPGFPEGLCDVNVYLGDRSQLRTLALGGTSTLVIPDGTPPLSAGSAGLPVSQLQRALNAAGRSPELMVDGDFGPLTEAAVKWLQGKAGIAKTGIYGEETEAALKSALKPPRRKRPLRKSA